MSTCWVIVCHSSTFNANSNKIFEFLWGVIQQTNTHGTHCCTASTPSGIKWYDKALWSARSQMGTACQGCVPWCSPCHVRL